MIDDVLNEIVDYMDGQLTIFCGAGISLNSGLPIVIHALDKILYSLNLHKKHKAELVGNNGEPVFPFETFMEVFLENSEDESLLRIFEADSPNRNHQLIAHLAKTKVITDIYTTNFDKLIETSLLDFNLKPNHQFKIFFRDSDFDPNYYNSESNIIRIFKVHGSMDDFNSIIATLKAVSSKTQSIRRQDLINRIFTNNSYKAVIFIGYSCSDYFDIIPEIEKVRSSKVRIIFIQHDSIRTTKSLCEVEDISQRTINNPFKNYTGYRITVNTDYFIEWLAISYGVTISHLERKQAIWEKCVDLWLSNFETDHMAYTILGQLFYKIPDYERAIYYYKKALRIDKANKDVQKQGAILNNIGLIYQDRFEYDKAIFYYKKALDFFLGAGFIRGIAAGYSNLGFAYAYEDWQLSLKYCKKAIIYARKEGHKFIEANAANNIGLMYKNKKEFDNALIYYFRTLEFDKDIGDKLGESITLTNIGTIFRLKGDFDKSLFYYERSRGITEKIGYKLGEAYVLHNLGLLYRNLEDQNTSLSYMNQAKELNDRFNFRQDKW